MNETRGSTNTETDFKKKENTRLVELIRTFHAPVERVWKAWSTSDSIQQWWGPEDFTSPKAEMDFKEGGKFIFAMESSQGEVNWSVGSITKLVPNQKIVFSETFGNEKGEAVTPEEAGMPDWPGDYHGTITVTFKKQGEDKTEMTINHTGIPASMHDECVEGWDSSLNKLQKMVERH